jgi:hypothetical protein
MIAPPWLLALGLVLGLLVLVPAGRLRAAGMSRGTVGLYALVLWALAMVMAIRPGATRVLVPVLILAYVAPLLVAPDVIARVLRRGAPERRPMKDVTPPDPPGLPPGEA